MFQFHLQQTGIYPGSGAADERGEKAGAGYTINIPLPAGAGREKFVAAFNDVLIPAMEKFKPQFILISAGFDSHRDDPLAGLGLTAPDYANLAHILCDIAERHSNGRIVSVLEGGYNLTALPESVLAHMEALADRAELGSQRDTISGASGQP